ncbi:MAG TPA: glycoside hydrolase family 15 protein [Pyrinomonadaceae bacterium]|nr:glycoside hydrolase family 15 protein [Pyrinomonadaceae bacterium]
MEISAKSKTWVIFPVYRFLSVSIFIHLSLILFSLAITAQTISPGGPGKDAQWATAGKQAVGTSASLESKVWFTLAQGVMTEVYYPDVTVANVHLLQFLVVDPKTKKVETEQDDAIHEIKVLRPDSLTFQQVNTAKSGKWKISKTYAADQKSNSILIKVEFLPKVSGLRLYVFYDPSLANSGMHDSGAYYLAKPSDPSDQRSKDVLSGFVGYDGEISSFLHISGKMEEAWTGPIGPNDGLTQLRKGGTINSRQTNAESGNIVQIARVTHPRNFVVTLSFARTIDDVVKEPFRSWIQYAFKDWTTPPKREASKFADYVERLFVEYEREWADYVKTIPKVDPKFQAQFNMAAMQLKALEDKTARGANIASLTVPWGGGENANENNVGGYHLVWARDLYQVFTAYMALGDRAAAERALDFLLKVQQKPDGSFPQNSWLDGKPFWGSLQMDEVAFPLIMAWQLGRFDKATYENHLKKAADFIVKNGPATPQERWEEESGYSPSTIAAEIAGLVCAADIAKRNGDTASAAKYLATADNWHANIENWTATKTGKYGDGNYYLRITQNGKPDAGEMIEINNGSGTYDERDIVDAGFLELVRLGLKPANDPLIAKSVKVIDQVIKVTTPNGDGFYRYNHDGYGEMDDGRRWNFDGKYTGKGRLWVLLSGERGQYEIALCNETIKKIQLDGFNCNEKEMDGWRYNRLDAMAKFANEGLMIPEQVWDKPDLRSPDKQFVPDLKFGEGTGSATPLAWSMAQFIRLATNIKAGKNLDTPQVVYDRYVSGNR